MADWEPKRESITLASDTLVLISESEDGSEQRRLISDKVLKRYKVQAPTMTVAQAKAYKAQFETMKGALTSFTFLDPLNNNAVTRVRFVPGTWNETFSGGVVRTSYELQAVLN